MQKIGVFVCHCGTNIAGTVDVKAVAEALSHAPGVVFSTDYQYMCWLRIFRCLPHKQEKPVVALRAFQKVNSGKVRRLLRSCLLHSHWVVYIPR